jgi:hypothetical protein
MRRPTLLLALACALLPAAPAPRLDAGEAPVRVGLVRVHADGPCLLRATQWKAVGVPSADRVELRRHGRPVALQRGSLGGASDQDLLFAATDTASGSSREAVYEVWRLPAPRPPAALPPPQGAPRPRVLAQDRVLGNLASADTDVYDPRDERGHPRHVPVWFLGFAPPGQGTSVDLGPLGATPHTPQQLVAHVYANWHGLVVLEATWGGHALGRAAVADAVGGADVRWRVPPGSVPERPLRLSLTNRSPPPPPPAPHDVSARRGTVFVDTLALQGPGATVVPWSRARAVRIEPAGPPADPLRRAGGAVHVILATPPLVAPAQALADHRTKHGLPSVVVPVTEVYDRYGHGEASWKAIHAFVRALVRRNRAPLRYLLLAGDATFDRTDLTREVTIPAPVARTRYNGATASDRLYTQPDGQDAGGPSVGRLPFRRPEELRAYVERLVRYETAPSVGPERRLLRFVTGEGHFGPLLDRLIESQFTNVLANVLPPAYDIEVTFASAGSPYLWPPPELDRKVVDDLNAGSLFLTYVGHGYAQGFDSLRVGKARYPVLGMADVPQVDVKGLPPAVLVLACTTAFFDGLRADGIGEALMKRPHGPIAYWGATRLCHPAYNALVGQALASHMGGGPGLDRLGDLLDRARDDCLDPGIMPAKRRMIATLLLMQGQGKALAQLCREGARLYGLLGDPALRLAFPATDLVVKARATEGGGGVAVTVRGPLPRGTKLHLALERPRDRAGKGPEPVADPTDPASFATIRRNHDRVNDLGLARAEATCDERGAAAATLALPAGQNPAGLVVKVHAVGGGQVHLGATRLPR